MVKRALLIGCNYPGTDAELRGCVNDVYNMKRMLLEDFGFKEQRITVLEDSPDSETEPPTGANIKKHLRRVVGASVQGDVLFMHFSGHGTQVPDRDGGEPDSYDEAIVPTDMNLISDDDLRAILSRLAPGVRFTMISDCCHSGSMLDHPEQQIYGCKTEDGEDGEEHVARGMDDDVLAEIFGGVVGEDDTNRSLPLDNVCSTLSNQTGGEVDATNIHHAMREAFGDFACAKTLKTLGVFAHRGETQEEGEDGGEGEIDEEEEAMLQAMEDRGLGEDIIGFFEGLFADDDYEEEDLEEEEDDGDGGFWGALFGPSPTEEDLEGAEGEGERATGVLVTGCQSFETSADMCPGGDPSRAYGALTHALTTTVREYRAAHPGEALSCRSLVLEVREMLSKAGIEQNPCLECEDAMSERPFVVG